MKTTDRQTRDNAILDAWKLGDSPSKICAALGIIDDGVVDRVIAKARRAGDTRAVRRGYHGQKPVAAMFDTKTRRRILRAWAAGRDVRDILEQFADVKLSRHALATIVAQYAPDQVDSAARITAGNAAVIDKVLNRWNSGESSGEIGKAVGLSRNRVIGLVMRARDNGDPRAASRRVEARKPSPPRQIAPSAPRSIAGDTQTPREQSGRTVFNTAPKRLPPTFDGGDTPQRRARLKLEKAGYGNDVDLMDLRPYHCRFPKVDADGKTTFCGKTRDGDASYCAKHRALAYDKAGTIRANKAAKLRHADRSRRQSVRL